MDVGPGSPDSPHEAYAAADRPCQPHVVLPAAVAVLTVATLHALHDSSRASYKRLGRRPQEPFAEPVLDQDVVVGAVRRADAIGAVDRVSTRDVASTLGHCIRGRLRITESTITVGARCRAHRVLPIDGAASTILEGRVSSQLCCQHGSTRRATKYVSQSTTAGSDP